MMDENITDQWLAGIESEGIVRDTWRGKGRDRELGGVAIDNFRRVAFSILILSWQFLKNCLCLI